VAVPGKTVFDHPRHSGESEAYAVSQLPDVLHDLTEALVHPLLKGLRRALVSPAPVRALKQTSNPLQEQPRTSVIRWVGWNCHDLQQEEMALAAPTSSLRLCSLLGP